MAIISYFPTNHKSAIAGKQDKLTGSVDQVVGFNAAGEAVPQNIDSFIKEITSQDVVNIWNKVTL